MVQHKCWFGSFVFSSGSAHGRQCAVESICSAICLHNRKTFCGQFIHALQQRDRRFPIINTVGTVCILNVTPSFGLLMSMESP